MALDRVRVRNYRALADVDIELGLVNVVFGPNGAGKTTLLDTIYFFRDCAIRGVEAASSDRDHGIGMLWDGAPEDARILVELACGGVSYALSFGLAAGRIDPYPGERLVSTSREVTLVERRPGSKTAGLFHQAVGQAVDVPLREPDKISLGLFLDFNRGDREAIKLDHVLRFVRLYHSRSFRLRALKKSGSESSHQFRLWDLGDNAWSVLRNVQDRRNVDDRYNTIMGYMAEAFPFFEDIVLEQTGPSSVYATFREKGRREAIFASGAADGVVQLLLLLIALFSEGEREAVVLLDEPEISLHPWAIAVLARAIKAAANQWGKQVFVATHSPVLISQFEPPDILVAQVEGGCARFQRLSEITEVADLLDEYAAGALYMSEAVAPQSAGVTGTGSG